jgi:hypothetical protein
MGQAKVDQADVVTRDFGATQPTLEGMKTGGFYNGSKPVRPQAQANV